MLARWFTFNESHGLIPGMNEITRRLTVTELTQRILEMAKTGVYRESIFETFQPLATKQHVRQAIRHAKQFGLHSVAAMRDPELGTYYQLDLAKFEAAKPSLHGLVPLAEADVFQRMTEAVVTIRMMLMIAGGGAMVLFGAGMFCILMGNSGMGWGFVTGSFSAIAIWLVQKALSQKLL